MNSDYLVFETRRPLHQEILDLENMGLHKSVNNAIKQITTILERDSDAFIAGGFVDYLCSVLLSFDDNKIIYRDKPQCKSISLFRNCYSKTSKLFNLKLDKKKLANDVSLRWQFLKGRSDIDFFSRNPEKTMSIVLETFESEPLVQEARNSAYVIDTGDRQFFDIFNIVKTFYGTQETVLSGFDLINSMVAYNNTHLHVHKDWFRLRGENLIKVNKWTYNTPQRISKYCLKHNYVRTEKGSFKTLLNVFVDCIGKLNKTKQKAYALTYLYANVLSTLKSTLDEEDLILAITCMGDSEFHKFSSSYVNKPLDQILADEIKNLRIRQNLYERYTKATNKKNFLIDNYDQRHIINQFWFDEPKILQSEIQFPFHF